MNPAPLELRLHAYAETTRALRSRVLIRPETCEGCGKKKRISAHHPDYTKALKVDWLCASCHKLAHIAAGDVRHRSRTTGKVITLGVRPVADDKKLAEFMNNGTKEKKR